MSIPSPTDEPLFVEPVLRLNVVARGRLSRPLDLKKASRAFPRATRLAATPQTKPPLPAALWGRLEHPDTAFLVFETGDIRCYQAGSEAQARQALEEVVKRLAEETRIKGGPTVEVVVSHALAFFGRGIRIESLPDRIADSLYVSWGSRPGAPPPGDFVEGRARVGDRITSLASREESLRAMAGLNVREVRMLDHNGYMRLRGTEPLWQLLRKSDKNGKALRTGCALLFGPSSEGQVRQSVQVLARVFENAGVYEPLTPLAEIPASVAEQPQFLD